MKIVICEDDVDTLELLCEHIKELSGMTIVGKARNSEELLEQCAAKFPDVVIMDIEIPGMSGLKSSSLVRKMLPNVNLIYVTAHSKYAIEAYETYPYDYILKPINWERLDSTLKRLKNQHIHNTKFVFKFDNEIFSINLDDIILICKDEKLTSVVTKAKTYYTYESLVDIWQRLDKQKFVRTHKSYILNKDKVERIVYEGRWTYRVYFSDIGQYALISKKNLPILVENY